MATLYIAEYPALEVSGIPVAIAPVLNEQTVAIGGSSASSSALGTTTGLVRLHTDSICSVRIDGGTAATTSNMRMVAGQTEYFAVHPGMLVSVIANT